ncbi:MAG: hypothetical protein ACREHD_07815, partial [Pirellulales bacterium]
MGRSPSWVVMVSPYHIIFEQFRRQRCHERRFDPGSSVPSGRRLRQTECACYFLPSAERQTLPRSNGGPQADVARQEAFA